MTLLYKEARGWISQPFRLGIQPLLYIATHIPYFRFNFFKASAKAVLMGSSSLFWLFRYFCTVRLSTLPADSFLRRASKADSFSRCPHLQVKICPSPSPR